MDETLTKELKTVSDDILAVQSQITKAVAAFQDNLTTLQQRDKELREAIKQSMENNGVKKFEDDFVVLTYVAPTTRKSIDTAALKEELPEIYENYSKESPVAASLRIKMK